MVRISHASQRAIEDVRAEFDDRHGVEEHDQETDREPNGKVSLPAALSLLGRKHDTFGSTI